MINKKNNLHSYFYGILCILGLLMLSTPALLQTKRKKLKHLTIENKTVTKEHDGRRFRPDELHALFVACFAQPRDEDLQACCPGVEHRDEPIV